MEHTQISKIQMKVIIITLSDSSISTNFTNDSIHKDYYIIKGGNDLDEKIPLMSLEQLIQINLKEYSSYVIKGLYLQIQCYKILLFIVTSINNRF